VLDATGTLLAVLCITRPSSSSSAPNCDYGVATAVASRLASLLATRTRLETLSTQLASATDAAKRLARQVKSRDLELRAAKDAQGHATAELGLQRDQLARAETELREASTRAGTTDRFMEMVEAEASLSELSLKESSEIIADLRGRLALAEAAVASKDALLAEVRKTGAATRLASNASLERCQQALQAARDERERESEEMRVKDEAARVTGIRLLVFPRLLG
jgi:chromosome segregation ATPase